jgi:hypothetical protein
MPSIECINPPVFILSLGRNADIPDIVPLFPAGTSGSGDVRSLLLA